MLGQVFDDASKFLAKTWLSREASVLPAFGSSQILRPHIHDGSMKIKDVHCVLRCWDAEIPWTYLHWRLLATALAGSFLFRMGALESWNSKHPFWELPGLILLLGGKVAVRFSSHNLAVVDSIASWTAFSLHALQPAIGRVEVEPSRYARQLPFLSVSKSFRPPWPVAAKVLESHLPSPSKMPKNASKSGCEILFSLQIRLLGW